MTIEAPSLGGKSLLNGNEDSTGIDVEGLSKCSQGHPRWWGPPQPGIGKKNIHLALVGFYFGVEFVQVFEICNVPFDREQESEDFTKSCSPPDKSLAERRLIPPRVRSCTVPPR